MEHGRAGMTRYQFIPAPIRERVHNVMVHWLLTTRSNFRVRLSYRAHNPFFLGARLSQASF